MITLERNILLCLSLTVTEINVKKVQKQDLKNIKNVKRCFAYFLACHPIHPFTFLMFFKSCMPRVYNPCPTFYCFSRTRRTVSKWAVLPKLSIYSAWNILPLNLDYKLHHKTIHIIIWTGAAKQKDCEWGTPPDIKPPLALVYAGVEAWNCFTVIEYISMPTTYQALIPLLC